MFKNSKKYDVAVINYPLMDPRIKPDDYIKYMGLDYTSVDGWEVPVYIHIPFCNSICKFCVYNRQLPDSAGTILKDYVEALKKEIRLYGKTPYIQSQKIGAIFLGGGTPTCLSATQLHEILTTLKDNLTLHNPEITVECNVANADEEKIRMFSEMGVTRVSTGVQTFHRELRDILELKISRDDIFNWISMVKKYPFRDLSIDLLYGLPAQTPEDLENDIKIGLELPINHFSIYKLTVFSDIKLSHELADQKVPELPEDDQVYEMCVKADQLLKEHGFILQSTQEYCQKEHGSHFWDLTYDGYGDNLSFGAFSFGYLNGYSYQNLSQPKEYIQAAQAGDFPVKMVSDRITLEQLMERSVTLGFRKAAVDKTNFSNQYGKQIEEVFGDILTELIDQNYVVDNGREYRLTPRGIFYQGNVSVNFMRSTFRKVSSFKKKMAIGMHVVPEVL